jgi:hypothetical protein
MTESTPLDRAEEAAREAATNSAAVQVALAAVELAKLASQQQAPACQHQAPQQPEFNAKKWLTIGSLAIIGGCVACALALAFALAAVGIAIGATCATACLIVLRSMWRDFTNR